MVYRSIEKLFDWDIKTCIICLKKLKKVSISIERDQAYPGYGIDECTHDFVAPIHLKCLQKLIKEKKCQLKERTFTSSQKNANK